MRFQAANARMEKAFKMKNLTTLSLVLRLFPALKVQPILHHPPFIAGTLAMNSNPIAVQIGWGETIGRAIEIRHCRQKPIS
jgi:hypothetical protein